MGFNASSDVEPIGYDFSTCGGPTGTTPEPSDEQMAEFWTAYAHFIRINRERVDQWGDRIDAIDAEPGLSEADKKDRKRQVEIEYEEAQVEIAAERKRARCEMMARVCSDRPSFDELAALPSRVLNGFEAYLLGELSPKGSNSGTNA